ncbi:MAG TPA: SIMPL domain-containing protein [Clostridia bacterium]|nr:SIMPL domain-containing protein [Clostridia bacterium]
MDNKKLIYLLVGTLLVIGAVAITGIITAGRVAGSEVNLSTDRVDDRARDNTLTVTGTGKVSIKPDVAYLEVGVRTVDKDAKIAQDENKDIMTKIVGKLASLNIEDKDIQTSAYNIWPRYNYNGNREILEGYEVENMLRVTVRKIDSVGEVLDAVSREGANRSYGISFGILDTAAVYEEALEKAMDKAKAKAEVMAKKAGVILEKPLAVYEGNTPNEIYPRGMTGINFVEDEMDSNGGVPIASGELEIEAHITIIYKVR